jgi:hypothetical protein
LLRETTSIKKDPNPITAFIGESSNVSWKHHFFTLAHPQNHKAQRRNDQINHAIAIGTGKHSMQQQQQQQQQRQKQ